jgi:predicted permease
MYTPGLLRVEARGAAADAVSEGVTPEYFDLLGARVAAGRFFSDADGVNAHVVVISDRFRRRFFGGRVQAAEVVDEALTIEGKPIAIVGVTAPGFDGLQFDSGADVFLPMATARELSGDTRPLRARYLVGRLAPSTTIAHVRAELRARWPAIQDATAPSTLSDVDQQALRSQRIDVEPLASGMSGLRVQYGRSLVVLSVLSGVLVAIACVNLAGLLLARSLARRHQVAISVALGASRGRIVQRTLVDGVLLALGGLLLSMPIPWWSIRVFAAAVSIAKATPLLHGLTPDTRVLGVTGLLTIVIGLAIGILPALRGIRAQPADELRPGRAMAGTLGRAGRVLLVAQVALSMVLVVGAGLFASTLLRLRANDGSLHTRRILWTRLAPVPGDRQPIGPVYVQALLRQLETLQGADAAALSTYYPAFLGFPGQLPTQHYESDAATPAEVAALTEFVSPGFFNLFGIARLRGRDFTWADDAGASSVVMISESVARRLFGGDDAVGRHLRGSVGRTTKEFEVVGVVADTAIGTIREPHQPVVFRPILQEATQARFPLAHVRVTGDVNTARDQYAKAVASQGRHFVRAVFTADQWVDYALLQERLTATLSAFAGLLTVVLASIGVYGSLAYAVTARSREMSLRLALGATRGSVIRMIVRDGLMVTMPGVLIGILCALAAGSVIRSQLYGVGPNDPSVIIGASVIFVVTAVIASFLPAFRASRADPIEALRQE